LQEMKYRPDILWYRLQGAVRRWWYKTRGIRPVSGPFVSGDSFRALAHHVWDEQDEPSFHVEDVKPYDIVFVSWHVWPFLSDVGPKIQVPFFLMTSNSDSSPGAAEVEAFGRTKGAHWWATSLSVPNSALASVLPLGLQNERFCWYGDVTDFYRLNRARMTAPLERICWGFAVENNPAVRGPIRKALRENPKAVELENQDPYSYRRNLVRYRYVACPPGNGQDTHRLWEALALGVIPVLLATVHTMNLKEQGLIPSAIVLSRPEDFAAFPADQEGRR
jgi:hypothetical protein